MKQLKFTRLFLTLLGCLMLFSCKAPRETVSIAYQSIRTSSQKPILESENGKEIVVGYSVDINGNLYVYVQNLTDKIMILDQTQSFLVNSDGISTAYYDPTVHTTTMTAMSSKTKGGSVNLGAVGGALGVGGILGSILNGVNVGGSGTSGTSTSNTTYKIDLPQIKIGPKGGVHLEKNFHISGLGKDALNCSPICQPDIPERNSYCTFSVCVSYSTDDGVSFNKIVTNMYANSLICVPVNNSSKSKTKINDALREIFRKKPDSMGEMLWILHANEINSPQKHTTIFNGGLFDYQ